MRWIDLHCDTVSELYKNKQETLINNSLCVDLKRLDKAGCLCTVFCLFCKLK